MPPPTPTNLLEPIRVISIVSREREEGNKGRTEPNNLLCAMGPNFGSAESYSWQSSKQVWMAMANPGALVRKATVRKVLARTVFGWSSATSLEWVKG